MGTKRKYKVEIEYELETDTVEQAEARIKATLNLMGYRVLDVSLITKRRSTAQNSALHLYLGMLEQECRNSGMTMDMIIKKPQELPITRHLLKDLFRLYGKTMYGKESTAKLDKNEFSTVLMSFQKVVAERLGISLPFPSIESLMDKEL